MKRKLTALLITAGLVLGLSSCGTTGTSSSTGTDDPTSNTDITTDQTTQDTTSSSSDTSSGTSVNEVTANRIEVKALDANELLSVGDEINLQEYVTVHYTDGTSSHTDFSVEVSTADTVSLNSDGYTLKIIHQGDFRVKIISGTVSPSYFTGTAYTELQVKTYEYIGEGLENYTAEFYQSIGLEEESLFTTTYKTEDYFLTNAGVEGGRLVNSTFSIFVYQLQDGSGPYEGTGNADLSEIVYKPGTVNINGEWLSLGIENFGLTLIEETINVATSDTTTEEIDGTFMNYNTPSSWISGGGYITQQFILQIWNGISYSGIDRYYLNIRFSEDNNLVVDYFFGDDVSDEQATEPTYLCEYFGSVKFSNIGTTSVPEVEATLNDASYIPEKLNVTHITDFVTKTNQEQNYTMTVTTTPLDLNGLPLDPVTHESELDLWSILVNPGTEVIKVTESSMLSSFTPSSQNLSGTKKQSLGMEIKDGKVYQLFENETNGKNSVEIGDTDATSLYEYLPIYNSTLEEGYSEWNVMSNVTTSLIESANVSSYEENPVGTHSYSFLESDGLLQSIMENVFFAGYGLTEMTLVNNSTGVESQLLDSEQFDIKITDDSMTVAFITYGAYYIGTLPSMSNTICAITVEITDVGTTALDTSDFVITNIEA